MEICHIALLKINWSAKRPNYYHFRTPTSCSVGDISTVICSADSGLSQSGITAIESGSWKLFFKKCSGDTITVAKKAADDFKLLSAPRERKAKRKADKDEQQEWQDVAKRDS